MQRRIAVLLLVVVVLALLVALNAASYVQLEDRIESEFNADRSTTNSGPTGTGAFFEVLRETDRKVVRWRKSAIALLNQESSPPGTFVVIGQLRREFDPDEVEAVNRWVAMGGHLVVIDRSPDIRLLPARGHWHIASETVEYPDIGIRSDNVEQMTAGVKPVFPAQPTRVTKNVEQLLRSRFAGRIYVYSDTPETNAPAAVPSTEPAGKQEEVDEEFDEDVDEDEASPAPLEHFTDGREGPGALVVDWVYGSGRISLVSDPFIVSNAGISLADNLTMAINVVSTVNSGVIAFDEFHHGRAATENQLLAYFSGTPILAISAQFAVILFAIIWTKGRRFGRPLPAPHVDRRSNLEFVASMAELQQRARAFDLAIENIYSRTRRALARYGGSPYSATYAEIANQVAARSGREKAELEELMRECEDAIAGAPVSAPRTLTLINRLRQIERELGIRMRSRELAQKNRNRSL